MRELVHGARVARLATVAADGRPRVVPFTFVLTGDTVYSAVDDKPKRTQRLARLVDVETNPEVALLVDHYDDDWSLLWWVRMRGPARVLRAESEEERHERERALDLLAAKYEQYRGRRPSGPVLAVDVEEWRGWSDSG